LQIRFIKSVLLTAFLFAALCGFHDAAYAQDGVDSGFGHYRISLGVSKPTFTDIKDYEDFYGDSRVMPSFEVDYFLFDWFMTVGLTFRVNFYKDRGHAVQKGTDNPDREGDMELTLVPLQAGIAVQGTPFRAKWVVLNGWFGYERTYFQEVRQSASSETEETADTGTSTLTADEEGSTSTDTSTDSDTGQYVNDGWKNATALGASVSFLLNGLDGQATNSLRSIGISGVYITPYMEVVRTMKKEGLTFSRAGFGLAFTFETI
jgi:hypothetical protein